MRHFFLKPRVCGHLFTNPSAAGGRTAARWRPRPRASRLRSGRCHRRAPRSPTCSGPWGDPTYRCCVISKQKSPHMRLLRPAHRKDKNKQNIPLKITNYFSLSHCRAACVGGSLLYSSIHIFGSPSDALIKQQQGPFEAERKLLCVDKYPRDIWVNLLSKYFPPPPNKGLFCSKVRCLIFVNSACDLLLQLASSAEEPLVFYHFRADHGKRFAMWARQLLSGGRQKQINRS